MITDCMFVETDPSGACYPCYHRMVSCLSVLGFTLVLVPTLSSSVLCVDTSDSVVTVHGSSGPSASGIVACAGVRRERVKTVSQYQARHNTVRTLYTV